MKKIILTFLIFMFLNSLNAQINCELIYDTVSHGSHVISNTNSLNWSNYTGYDYNSTSIKVVKLTFHIIQKADSSNNFPNNANSNQLLSIDAITNLNNSMGVNIPMNLGINLAPFQSDTRIRFELANIYYWNDDYDNVYRTNYSNYYNGIYYSLYGDYLTAKYVTNKSNVDFKTNSVHVFFCMGGSSVGGHTTLGNSKWMILTNMSTSDPAFTFRTIKHEMGHVMGLDHSWISNDGCEDTPSNPNCWDQNNCIGIQSNNTMDYNNCQCAFTQCQINKMHYYLLGNIGVVSECLKNNPIIDNPQLQSNSDFLCSGGNENVSTVTNLPFGVTIDWTTSSITNNLLTESAGNTFSMTTSTTIKEVGQIVSQLNYGKLGYTDLQRNIYLNGLNDVVCPNGYLNENIVGKNIVTKGQSTKIAPGSNIILYYDESVALNPGFEVELNGQLSTEKKVDECK